MPSTPLRRVILPGLFIVAAAFIPTKAKAQDKYKDDRNADIDARGATSARIDAAAGSLRIEGRPGISSVKVRGIARSSRRDDLDDIKLIAERRGSEVFIKVDIPDENREGWRLFNGNLQAMALDLVIEVPVTLALNVDDGSGEVEIINTGSVELEDGSGNVEIRGTHGNVRVSDGSGNVIIDGIEGNVRVSDGSGEIRGRNITGDFTVDEDGSGNIDVSDVGGTMRVDDDGSGNIDVDRVAGDFVVNSDGSGSIRYDTVKGRIDIPRTKRRG